MKTVGRRSDNPEPVPDLAALLRTLGRLQGGALVPRGLYRFETHEEAQAWMERELIATLERRSSQTS